MTAVPVKRSRARIGADEARVWARRLRLGNPYAKAIMLALANYMDEEGSAFPGVETLASDTDISEDTVTARLRWLESIGAIAIFKCWRDENGRRNHDGRGKVTSSTIRFLFDADKEAVEAAAQANVKPATLRGAAALSHAAKAEISPRPQREQNEIREQGVSPGVAPEQPPTSAALTEELEDSPQSPPLEDGVSETPPVARAEGVPYERFTEAYGEGSVRPERARALWEALTDDERDLAIRGAKGYRTQRLASKKSLFDPERFLRNRDLWTEFAAAPASTVVPIVAVDADSDPGLAWKALCRIGGIPSPQISEKGGRSVLWLKGDVPPAVLALLNAPPEKSWGIVQPGEQAFGAWRDFVVTHTGKQPVQQKHIVGQIDGPPDKEGKPTFAGYRHQSGLKVPALFPPRVDGSWPEVPPKAAEEDDIDPQLKAG